MQCRTSREPDGEDGVEVLHIEECKLLPQMPQRQVNRQHHIRNGVAAHPHSNITIFYLEKHA